MKVYIRFTFASSGVVVQTNVKLINTRELYQGTAS